MVTKESMRATLVEMEPGKEIEISLSVRSYNTIRNCASLLGGDLGRKYSVAVNRAAGVCKVTRIS